MPGACGTRLYVDFSGENPVPRIMGLTDIESFSDHATNDNERYFNYDLYCRGSYTKQNLPVVAATVRNFIIFN